MGIPIDEQPVEGPVPWHPFVLQLDELTRSRKPLIAVVTSEDGRLQRLVEQMVTLQQDRDLALDRDGERAFYTWDAGDGLTKRLGAGTKGGLEPQHLPFWEQAGQPPLPTSQPDVATGLIRAIADGSFDPQQPAERGIFLLRDFGPWLDGAQSLPVVAALKNLAAAIRTKSTSLVFSGPRWPDLPELEKYVHTVELPLPTLPEHRAMLVRQVATARRSAAAKPRMDVATMTDHDLDRFAQALLGLDEDQADSAVCFTAVHCRGICPGDLPTLIEQKTQLIKSEALEYVHPEPLSNFGGMPGLIDLLRRHAATHDPRFAARRLRPAKGLFVFGVPGGGKDLLMRVAASIFEKPLVIMDVGAIMGSLVGQSEANIRSALRRVIAMRGILGIREFEKALGGVASSNQTDGGTLARAAATLLNWMSDQQGEVYVMASANDITQIAERAGEQLRAGRFSDVVFMDLPTMEDRGGIWSVHLRKIGFQGYDTDWWLADLIHASTDFTGAEIEEVCQKALGRACLDGNRDVAVHDLLEECHALVPTAHRSKEQIDALRAWAQKHLAVNSREAKPAPARPEADELAIV